MLTLQVLLGQPEGLNRLNVTRGISEGDQRALSTQDVKVAVECVLSDTVKDSVYALATIDWI
jgi:hypothetical protein